MGVSGRICLTLLAVLGAAQAQDERRVQSPDGRLEFRIFVAQPEAGSLYRLGYRLLENGRAVLETSYLGFDIHNQEPLLGENDGLIHTKGGHGEGYNWLTAEYMQNGSLGRLLTVEIRVWNRGAAFRYVIPRSTPLEELLIDDELTEFDFARGGVEGKATVDLPFAAKEAGGEWIGISEAGGKGYPRTQLVHGSGNILRTHLTPAASDGIALETRTPFTGPWRVIQLGADRDEAMAPGIARELSGQK